MLKYSVIHRKNMPLVVKNDFLFAFLQSQIKPAYLT
jgi:hypothetical protein